MFLNRMMFVKLSADLFIAALEVSAIVTSICTKILDSRLSQTVEDGDDR